MQIFPRESAWNEDISRRPLLANSDAMIAQIITDLRSDRRMLRAFHEMNFVLVPDNQPLVPIDFIYYGDESDPSPYPIPTNLPVETWPRETAGLSLPDWQRDINDTGGDRHSIMVMPGAGFIWETWVTRLTSTGWEAGNGAKFDLKSNTLRPFGWTSGDAAGLPIFPALVRYDECQRGMVEHAMRIVVRRSRLGPIYPATHHASVGNLTDPNIPAMGQRVRLKSSFVIPDSWTIYEKAVLRGLKKYGAMVADNGNFFSISVTPDDRYPANAFSHLSSIAITNFEVVQTTGPNEGHRSPNPPQANAGADLPAAPNTPLQLNGAVLNASTAEWKMYSGPGQVTFSDAARHEHYRDLQRARNLHTPLEGRRRYPHTRLRRLAGHRRSNTRTVLHSSLAHREHNQLELERRRSRHRPGKHESRRSVDRSDNNRRNNSPDPRWRRTTILPCPKKLGLLTKPPLSAI